MPSLRKLAALKWSPALIWGHITGDDIAAETIEHEHMQADYVENTFGTGATGVLRKIQRVWIQDGALFSEATDEF